MAAYCSGGAENTRLLVGRSGTTVVGMAPLASGCIRAATARIWESCSATFLASEFWSL